VANEQGKVGSIVIAGGTGFIGQALVRALAAHGEEVIVLTRATRASVRGARCVTWTPGLPGPWTECLGGARAVVNLCGETLAGRRWSDARKRVLLESRTRPAAALASVLRPLGRDAPKLLQASGVGYFGTGDAPVDETAPAGDDFLARLAVAWEAALAPAPPRTAVLRFGVVLGPGGALPRMVLPFRLFAGGPIHDGRQWLSWIHFDDAVAAIRFALDRDLDGPVNVTAPEAVRNAEFARIAGATLRRPAWFRTPRWALELLLGEQATLVCDGQRARPARLLAAGFNHAFPDLQSALENLLA
jgi:uncharacterized protein